MSLPGNGIFVVRGEMSTLMTAMRRGSRWNSTAYVEDDKDALMKLFVDLKQILNRVEDLRLIDPNVFLTPFLEVIRTDETTGVVTSLALASINKFLSYGLIDPTSLNLAATVENIVDAVTHARFMGTDQSSDGVTLFRVVEVLHTLMRSPEGSALTNEAVCEVMLSCFKICFEPRLNELLRRSAEQALKDMVLLLFMRLPQFSEDRSEGGLLRKFQMMAAAMDEDNKRRSTKQSKNLAAHTLQRSASQRIDGSKAQTVACDESQSSQTLAVEQQKTPHLATTPATPAGNILDMQGKITQTPTTALGVNVSSDGELPTEGYSASDGVQPEANTPIISIEAASPPTDRQNNQNEEEGEEQSPYDGSSEYINSVGVRFTQQNSIDGSEGVTPLLPYGLPCIQELFRFLILLCNPLDKQNTDTMMHMGLSLLTVAFEVGADNIGKYDTLLELVKDDLCRNLIALMHSERLTIFAADLQLCFLLFESLRGHLKFQLEAYLRKIAEIIASDNPRTPYEMRELALDNLLQLWRIPGFVAELYINYDCDLYCSDMFEQLTNLLSKYTLSATNAVYGTHVIAMDTLISVIESIERNCVAAKTSSATPTDTKTFSGGSLHRHSRQSSGLDGIVIQSGQDDSRTHHVEHIAKFMNTSTRLRLTSSSSAATAEAALRLTREQLADVKRQKRVLSQGTELFNQRPDKGIQYLQENGILRAQLDPMEVALFLRENPGLDKKMIGEYISRKKNVDSKILMNFVDSFDFTALRVDQALRLYLETFRLPGEAPLIFLVLEHFADHWHNQNGAPFANTDAAFSLAYAIIMLNMDQHNSNAKRLNVPMTQEDFLKNLRGLNGGIDFDQEMLSNVYNAIKNDEIIMPAEQTGLVRENYLWKVLLRRGVGPDGVFNYVQDDAYDTELFSIIWGASLSALSFMFDKNSDSGFQRTLAGFTKCASISAHYNLHADFDALILTLCKFTTLQSSAQQESNATPALNDITMAANFGQNLKAQASMRTVFALVHDYGDSLREGWSHILDLLLQLFRLKLLPSALIEVEDFCEENGRAQLIIAKPFFQKPDAGLLFSLYSYLASEGQREPSYEEKNLIAVGRKCVEDCQLEQMMQESIFVQLESLEELVRCLLALLKAPNANKSVGLAYAEDVTVFWMEFLVKIVIQNRDRMIALWPGVRDRMYLLLLGSASCGYDYLLNRSIVAVLKLAIHLMRNEELCPIVLQSLKMLLMLRPAVLLRISKQISIGIYELLKTAAQNIHSEQDWQIIFTVLECVGAGAVPPEFDDAALPVPNGDGSGSGSGLGLGAGKSDCTLSSEDDSGLPDRGYISDSELSGKLLPHQVALQSQTLHSNTSSPFASSPTAENWILVNKDTDLSTLSRPQSPPMSSAAAPAPPLSTLIYHCKLVEHSPFALFKCWDSLAFIVRNVAHITPFNIESCIRCIRTFVEACRDGGIRQRREFEAAFAASHGRAGGNSAQDKKKKSANKRSERAETQRKSASAAAAAAAAAASASMDGMGLADARSAGGVNVDNEEDLVQRYEMLSIQLLDLMYTLYTRTAQIFRWWAEEGDVVPECSALWAQSWCPLLQGIARLAMDRRREVRTYAISCLQQRALLVHDLQTLSGAEWASCFQLVLFPLLAELLPGSAGVAHLDDGLLEESRIRTATIMSKVFLHHLTPLIDLGSAFSALWLEILDYIDKFMHVGSDMLSEQMQEILKNMLLVMHSVRVFHNEDGTLHLPLWQLTWQRIEQFLPQLKAELFRDEGNRAQVMSQNTAPGTAATAAAIAQHTIESMSVPHVEILPNRQQQPPQPLPTGLLATQTPIVPSPVGSPRHSSIILQPPAVVDLQQQSLIMGQPPMPTNIPMLLPQPAAPSSSPLYAAANELALQQPAPLLLPMPIPFVVPAAPLPVSAAQPDVGVASVETLPALLNDASKCVDAQLNAPETPASSPGKAPGEISPESGATAMEQPPQQLEQPTLLHASMPSNSYSSYSFSIELPETPPTINVYGEPKRELAANATSTEEERLQHQYQQYYQQYQPQLLQQPQTPAVETATTTDVGTRPTAPPPAEAEDATAADSINVPISHLLAGNQYPSLAKQPNTAILQSFSPVYVQSQGPQSGADIYQDYVQNPYNLTLQLQQQLAPAEQQQQQVEQPPAMFNSRYTSPANYFNSSVDPSAIPPGSEMLYGQP